jgi:hypothetical protein
MPDRRRRHRVLPGHEPPQLVARRPLLAFSVQSAGIMGNFGFSGIDLLDAAGVCVGCNLHEPFGLQSVTAFDATAGTLTVSEHGGVRELPADGLAQGAPARPLSVSGATHADWSSHGRSSFSARAAGRAGSPPGAAPVWSPDGAASHSSARPTASS